MINIILCGGSGTRMWPLSRQLFPKQFVKLLNNSSLFQDTISRNRKTCDEFYIVTNKNQQNLAISQTENTEHLNSEKFSYILEPVGRNTAPAIALACLDIEPDEIVLVTPSDHLIENIDEYMERVKIAENLAKEGNIVTFGIQPHYPETGYGYIEVNKTKNKDGVYKAVSFKEKPSAEIAEKYLSSGSFYWNSGMFAFKARVFLEELRKYAPDIYEKSKKAFDNSEKNTTNDLYRSIYVKHEDMMNIPSDSIDYAIMEKSDKVYVVSADIGWNDLGSFDAIYDIRDKDKNGNSKTPSLVAYNSKDNLVISEERKIALISVQNMIIVDTPDALLVAQKGDSQFVKNIVTELQSGTSKDKDLTIFNNIVTTDWGYYKVLDKTDSYKVIKMSVKPSRSIPLQKHSSRTENWKIVEGKASIYVNGVAKNCKTNDSVEIPIEAPHKIKNIGKKDLIIIEIQSGNDLNDNDVIFIKE